MEIQAEPLCRRQVICMDFMKESTKDLLTYDYDATLLTFWLLEGLIMYMSKPAVTQMINEIVDLSVKGSCICLMYMNGPEGNAANIDYIEAFLFEKGWRGKQECFGGNVINYGRWPAD